MERLIESMDKFLEEAKEEVNSDLRKKIRWYDSYRTRGRKYLAHNRKILNNI